MRPQGNTTVSWQRVTWPDGSRWVDNSRVLWQVGRTVDSVQQCSLKSAGDHACSYEGLVKDDMCHLRGVSNFADGDRQVGTAQALSFVPALYRVLPFVQVCRGVY